MMCLEIWRRAGMRISFADFEEQADWPGCSANNFAIQMSKNAAIRCDCFENLLIGMVLQILMLE
tara:strand:+ start:9990 stop:10181 length:192 start_codon:yes stop_codon:yes gene_type:complete